MTGFFKTLFSRKAATRRQRQRALSEAVKSHLEPLESRQLMSVDLTSTFVTSPLAAQGGTRQSVVLNIQNLGTTRASGSVPINVYAVPEGTAFDPATATLVGRARRSGSLGSGDTVGSPIRVATTTGQVAGNYRLFAVVDPNNRFADTNA